VITIAVISVHSYQSFTVLNSLLHADLPLTNYSLTHPQSSMLFRIQTDSSSMHQLPILLALFLYACCHSLEVTSSQHSFRWISDRNSL